MTHLVLTKSNFWQFSRREKRYSLQRINKKQYVLSFLLLLLILILSVFYAININTTALLGYKIDEIKKDIKSLNKENQGLNIKLSSLKSVASLESQASLLDFTKASEISYIKVGVDSVAILSPKAR